MSDTVDNPLREASSKPADEHIGPTVESPNDQSQFQKRTAVRFPSLRRKAAPPSPYIHVDEALNRVGEELFFERWGIGPGWEEHPFQYVKRKKGFFSYSLVQNDQGGFRIELSKLKSDCSKQDRKACHRAYRQVRN